MELISKPHKIDGFRFELGGVKPPKWFVRAHEENRVQVTITKSNQYITIYSSPGNMERADVGDWICMNSAGKIFKITHEERMEAYE